MKKYRCTICNEIIESETVPSVCPVCSVGEEYFVEVVETKKEFRDDTNEYFLIIGNGASGFNAANAIRQRNKTCKITILTNESELSYYRPTLSDLITEELTSDFYIKDKKWYDENNILTLLNTEVSKINEDEKTVTLAEGHKLKYDKLILANGSSNFIPQMKGIELENVFTLKNYKDLQSIKSKLSSINKVCVIGGGILGLEVASELKDSNKEVVIIDRGENILSRQLDKDGSLILENYIKKSGVEIKSNAETDYIGGTNKVEKLVFKDGTTIDCDAVILSIGVRANTQIAKDTTISVNKAIVVDKNMKTTAKDIFACGDVCELDNQNIAIWPVAVEMGKVAGANACGDNLEFKFETYPISLEAFGTKVISVGNINEYDKVINKSTCENNYEKLFIKNDVLVGAIFINDTNNFNDVLGKIGTKFSE